MTAMAQPSARTGAAEFRVDEEFESLCPRLTEEERELLAASIRAHGVREPLVVWREEQILLDGHTRLAICEEQDISFETVEYSFADRAAARNWVIDNALARRNLGREQQAHLRGLRYRAAKRASVENLRQNAPSAQIEHSVITAADEPPLREEPAAVRLAREYGVSPATIRRDAEYAENVDAIAESAGPEARTALLTGAVRATRGQVKRIAEARPQSLAEFKRMVGEVGPPARSGDNRDHVEEVSALAQRTAAAMRAYVKSGARPEDRERLTELWELRSDIERLSIYLEGETRCT